MVATASENTLLVAGKGKVSMKAKYTFTENFVIRVSLRFIQFQSCFLFASFLCEGSIA